MKSAFMTQTITGPRQASAMTNPPSQSEGWRESLENIML